MSVDNHNVALSPAGDPEYASPSELSALQTQAQQIWNLALRTYPDNNLGNLKVRADQFCVTFEYQEKGPAARNKLTIYYDDEGDMWLVMDVYSPTLEDEGHHTVEHSIIASPLTAGQPCLITLETGLMTEDGYVLREVEYAEYVGDPLTRRHVEDFTESFDQLNQLLSPEDLPGPRRESPRVPSVWSRVVLGD